MLKARSLFFSSETRMLNLIYLTDWRSGAAGLKRTKRLILILTLNNALNYIN